MYIRKICKLFTKLYYDNQILGKEQHMIIIGAIIAMLIEHKQLFPSS